MRSMDIADGFVRYVDQGQGAAVVLLPPLGYSHTIWREQIQVLSSGYRVLALDPRGVGTSSRLHGWRGLLRRQANDIVALLDQLDVERAVVCGVSYGGVLAQRFAVDYPDRTAGLITVDSFSETRPHSIPTTVNRVAMELTGWLWLFPGLMRPAIRRLYAPWPDALSVMEDGLASIRRVETVKLRYALNWVNMTSELSRVRSPALAIVADSPWLRPLSQRIVDALPDSRLRVVENSFDPTNLCQPETFNRVVWDFIRELDW
ncbi:alpha/beta fold hydrolase [Spiractinospora alimapuensis]|uniref:alpha/beta fold hydrolase n=1 Tax=Spiractinospora alimapuensis TaxID=2820884 RepID=UPI001F3D0620|nr:alpha/beta hydrolase [Spiractinospora alimapuensis]QVQ50425.1 alpha/beta fold hydrolase [Spiractinospora alimapuensis]